MMQRSHALDRTLNVELVVTLRWLNRGLGPVLGRWSTRYKSAISLTFRHVFPSLLQQ